MAPATCVEFQWEVAEGALDPHGDGKSFGGGVFGAGANSGEDTLAGIPTVINGAGFDLGDLGGRL